MAKIDGENWYDISKFVKKVTVNNQIQLLDVPTIDTAKLTVKNDNNAFTSTVFNDEFNPSVGKINGTIEQGYLNKIWEIQIYTTVDNGTTTIDIPIFHGWKPNQAITEKHKEAEIELKDILWITTQKRLKNPLLYTSMTPNAIIADLLERCGIDVSYQDLQQLNTTFDVFIAEQDKTYWQIIQNICEATAGVISTSPEGKIIYRTRIESFTEPSIVLTINQENFSKYNLEQKAKYNQLKVESEGYEISASNEDLLVDTTLTGDAAIIKAGQTQNFEFEYTSEYGKDFANTVFITVKLGDTIVDNLGAFSQGDDDGFIRLNKLTAYPDKLVLNITNLASTVDYTIAQVRFRGRQIKKLSLNSVEELNITDEPDNEISIKSYYSDTSILSNVLDALKFNINKDIVFSLSLNEFYPDIFAGNLVNFNIPLKGIASGTFIIEQIKHIINDDLSYNTELVISEWKDIVFDIGTKEIYKSTPVEVITESSEQSRIEEIVGSIDELKEDMQEQKDITSYLDGIAPDTPTGLLVTTEVINRESVLKVSFNPNDELDLLGYEIAYSQDSVWWQYNVVSETSVYIQVIGNTEYFVKVRAFDAEGFKSAWTNVVSIVSAKDTIPPEAPTGLTVEPLFQKIIVKWTPNEEPDLLKYSVQVSLDNFVTVKDTIYTDSNYIVYGGKTNTLYYFRVSAIDTSENMSEYSNVVSATTAAVYDEDLESAIIEEMENNLETLNNETLPALQE
ncbi:MAG: fibronectin type III domain-containing protein, partial [Bacteroidales bacterium]